MDWVKGHGARSSGIDGRDGVRSGKLKTLHENMESYVNTLTHFRR